MNHKNVLFASAAALACAAAGAVAQPWEYAVIEIDDLGYGSSGRAINDLGWITGTADNGFDLRAYLWAEPGPMLDLGSLPGGSGRSRGWGINNLGWVAGESSNSEDRTVPVLWRDGKITEIDGPGSFVGMGYDVNDAGIVVGPASWELSGGNRKWIGFRWHNGTLHQLVGLMGPDTGSYASAINEFGDIAGSSEIGRAHV